MKARQIICAQGENAVRTRPSLKCGARAHSRSLEGTLA